MANIDLSPSRVAVDLEDDDKAAEIARTIAHQTGKPVSFRKAGSEKVTIDPDAKR